MEMEHWFVLDARMKTLGVKNRRRKTVWGL